MSFEPALRAIARSVAVVSDDEIEWNGRREKLRVGLSNSATASEVAPEVEALGQLIYQRSYARPSLVRGGYASVEDRGLADKLANAAQRAIAYREVWTSGWTKTGEEGGLVQISRPGLPRASVRPEKFDEPRGRTLVGSISAGEQPGWIHFRSEAEEPTPKRTLRLYWNLSVTGALVFVNAVSRTFSAAGLPFRAKVAEDPDHYWRADAGVLYLDADRWTEAAVPLRASYAAVAPHLKSATPAFAKPIAHGLGLAEDPGGGQSFGLHRSRIIAGALYAQAARGATSPEWREEHLLHHLRERGYAIEAFHLSPGSAEIAPLELPPTRAVAIEV